MNPNAPAPRSLLPLLLTTLTLAFATALAQPTIVATAAGVGLSQPHSVIHAVAEDVYLVSNVGGTAGGRADHGFISRISPAGDVLELRWIDGARPGIALDAPRGMGIFAGRLWIADVDDVRVFDVRTGEHLLDVPIVGARELTGLAIGLDGSVFVTDVGEGLGTRYARGMAVYRIDRELRVDELLSGPDAPPAVAIATLDREHLAIATADGELLTVRLDGTIAARRQIVAGSLGGVVVPAPGEMLTAAAETSSVLRVSGDRVAVLIDHIGAPADLGYDATRNRLLVPSLPDHRVTIVQLP